MRILVCSPVIPYPPASGLKLRVYNLARELARGHEVNLFCLSTAEATEEQRQALGAAGLGLTIVTRPDMGFMAKSAAYLRRLAARVPLEFILSWEEPIFTSLRRLESEGGFDVALAEHLFMARYAASLDCPRVLVLHNIESTLARELSRTFPPPVRQYRRLAAAWAGSYEKRMLGKMDGAVTVTEADREVLGRMAPGLEAIVVENGVDCSAFSGIAAGNGGAGHRLLYIGLMSYESNIDAVRWFTSEVFPLIRDRYPDATFTIAGADPAPSVVALADSEGVEVTGFVDDVRPLYRDSSILVVPLRHGGGSRLKILEAFAAGTPVVSTSKGAEGLDVEEGTHLLVADSPGGLAAAVSRLFTDEGARASVRSRALELVKRKYDWPILAEKLAGFLERISRGR